MKNKGPAKGSTATATRQQHKEGHVASNVTVTTSHPVTFIPNSRSEVELLILPNFLLLTTHLRNFSNSPGSDQFELWV